MRPSGSLERKFAEALFATNREAAQLGCYSPEFDAMLKVHGGIKTAERLVVVGEPQSGLRKLRKIGRLDLSTEAVMLQPEYQSLFSKKLLDAASWNLQQMEA